MKYDDASWHYGGNFPSELPPEAGATHIGMFVAWAMLSGFAGTIHKDEFPLPLQRLQQKAITPGQFFVQACDEKFTDEDLNDEGNAFAQFYFDFKSGSYIRDYETTLGQNLPTLYHVADTWGNFDLLKPVIDERFSRWKQSRAT